MRFVSSIIYSILIGFVLLSCSNVTTAELQVRECARMPEARAAASASAIGNMGYVFGGRNAQNEPTADLWQYDADADQWTSLGNTPLLPRVNAAMCADDNYLYVGLGFGGKHYDEDSTYYRDFWRYSPTDNTFSRLRDFPSDATDRPVTLMLDGKIYFFFGWKDEFNRDVYIYDINADSWEKQTFDLKKNDFPPRVFAATGAVCQNRLFVGTGFMHGSRNFWAEYISENGTFRKCTPLPFKGRHNATSASDGEYVYVIGGWHYGDPEGSGFYHDDIVRYNPASDEWEYCGAMPVYSGRHNMISFTAKGKVYFGLGENETDVLKTLYCIEK